jgi:T-complex protein 1 subunit beta
VSLFYLLLILEHVTEKYSSRLDMDEGSIGSMKELGVTESYKLKRQVVLSASEAAEMIIRYALVCF